MNYVLKIYETKIDETEIHDLTGLNELITVDSTVDSTINCVVDDIINILIMNMQTTYYLQN